MTVAGKLREFAALSFRVVSAATKLYPQINATGVGVAESRARRIVNSGAAWTAALAEGGQAIRADISAAAEKGVFFIFTVLGVLRISAVE
jgi:hypothetical protein